MKGFVRVVILLFLIYSALSFIIGLIGSINQEDSGYFDGDEYQLAGCDEYSVADTLEADIVLTHFRSWSKYSYDSMYCLSYALSTREVLPSYEFRNSLETQGDNYENYWRNVYFELFQRDRELISFLQDSLESMAVQNSISRNDLARLIVSFVQDIPYSYVMPGPCDKDDHPCLSDQKFGILSPVEFLYSLMGDCDTRSVLLYGMLKHFGFNPLIVISNEYRHAMIAIDLPATGDYILHKGKKFYFWETTNTGWLPGMLPPGSNNVAYWKISLDHEYQAFTSRHR